MEIDSPKEFDDLSEEEQHFLLSWISENLEPIKSINRKHSSYAIKHWIENDYPERYFTNGAFKGAMLKAGYIVGDEYAQNWHFNISERSPYLLRKKSSK